MSVVKKMRRARFLGRPKNMVLHLCPAGRLVCHLSHLDPTLLLRGAVNRIAHGLHGGSLLEVRRPRSVGPCIEKVAELVDEARSVADALSDRPPVARERVAWVFGP